MMEKAKVYFTKELTPEAMVKMYETLGVKLPGKVAVELYPPGLFKAGDRPRERHHCGVQHRL